METPSNRLLQAALLLATTLAQAGVEGLPEWSADFAVPSGCNGPIFAAAQAENGQIYLGGSFSACGDVTANRVVRFNPADNRFNPLGTPESNGVNRLVRAIAVDGDDVYIGGDFSRAGALTVSNIARFDGTTWHALGEGVSGGPIAQVRALAVDDGVLYVGGRFTTAGGVAALNVARFDGADWSALGDGIPQAVLALIVHQNRLHAGTGDINITSIPGSVRIHELGQWSELAATNGAVAVLASNGGELFAGGSFSEISGLAIAHVARHDGADWSELGENGAAGVNADVQALIFDGPILFVGGAFTEAGGAAASRIARFDGAEWEAIGQSGSDGVNGTVLALTGGAQRLIAAGVFDTAAGQTANYVVNFSGDAFFGIGPADGLGLNGPVEALIWHEGALIAGGGFTRAGTTAARRIARLDADGWHPLGSGMSDLVRALASANGTLWAGGDFVMAGDQVVNFVARWDGAGWLALGPPAQPGLAGQVFALAARAQGPSSELAAAGVFLQTATGVPVNRISRLDQEGWQPLGPTNHPGVNDRVDALVWSGETLVAGGFFSQAGDIDAARVAGFDGQNWFSLADAGGQGLSGSSARSLLKVGTDLYVGGLFNNAGASGASGLAIWDGAEWIDPGAKLGNQIVQTLTAGPNAVLIGGGFNTIGNTPAARIAAFDGASFQPLGMGLSGGLSDQVRTVVWTPNGLYAGGSFGRAGAHAAGHLSLWRAEILFADGFEAEPTP